MCMCWTCLLTLFLDLSFVLLSSPVPLLLLLHVCLPLARVQRSFSCNGMVVEEVEESPTG